MITVCVCTHNPNPAIFGRCIASLRAQRLPPVPVEMLVIDNRSTPPISVVVQGLSSFPYPVRVVREERIGLTQARFRGLEEARGNVLVFADDDNIFAPDYLVQVERLLRNRPEVGALGGRNLPLPEVPIPGWFDEELLSFLVCLDRGDVPLRLLHERTPYGAGIAVRTEAFRAAAAKPFILGDRTGARLSSGGDTELCYRLRIAGWQLWYEPSLRLDHYLPARRLTVEYLEQLNHGFGLDRPCVEFYWFRGTWMRRLSYLRRSLRDRRMARREAALFQAGVETNANVRHRLRAAFLRGQSETLRQLAFGPAIWRGVPALDPSR